jgi:hypothetical protein
VCVCLFGFKEGGVAGVTCVVQVNAVRASGQG